LFDFLELGYRGLQDVNCFFERSFYPQVMPPKLRHFCPIGHIDLTERARLNPVETVLAIKLQQNARRPAKGLSCPLLEYRDCRFSRSSECKMTHISIRDYKMLAEAIDRTRPAFAEQDQRPWREYLHNQLVPHQRNLGYSSHSPAQSDVPGGLSNQYLQPRVKIGARFDLLEIRIGRGFELFHGDADYVTIRFVSAAADCFHNARVPAGANLEAGFDQQAAEL
jgi:hypothetical protein